MVSVAFCAETAVARRLNAPARIPVVSKLNVFMANNL
jgi:hypothetical protein